MYFSAFPGRACGSTLALLLLACCPALASSELVLEFFPEETEIELALDATLHEVRGSAPLGAGRLRVDPGGGRVEGELSVDARMLSTGNRRRDRKMHRDVLESERFPQIVLRPRSFDGTWPAVGEATDITVRATLEIHGEGHSLVFDATVERRARTLRFDARFEIPYVEWGMKDPSRALLRVGKVVTVALRGQAALEELE